MSYRLFKPTYTDRKTGKQVSAASHYIEFRDHVGARHRWPAFPDEKRSNALAVRLARLVDCRRYGETPDQYLCKWLESQPPELMDKLTAVDLIDAGDVAKGAPLIEHLRVRPTHRAQL